jgi:hypothetical protein
MTRLARTLVLCLGALLTTAQQAQQPAAPGTQQQAGAPAATVPEEASEPPPSVAEAETDTELDLSPRARYNRGVESFRAGDWEGATAAFLQARDEAGPDPELRYRAAFNLGLALATQADVIQDESPEEAIELLRQSSAWFNDAIRLGAESDEDARINLELVLRRIQLLADQLNEGRKLEARLDRVIDDQRSLRDGVRKLLQAAEAEGVSADPLIFQTEFEDLATRERMLQAESGSILDLAAEERSLLEEMPDEERTDRVRFRLVQLQNLDHYLQQARQSLSDSRRRLRRLEGERAHRRADAALAELKRAREQLLDPIAVLKSLVQDETVLLDHTRGLETLRGGGIRLENDRPLAPPRWLTVEHLSERQQSIALRTEEVLARLRAGVGSSEDDVDGAGQDPDTPPEQQRMLEAAREALPFVEDAREAMEGAWSSIVIEELEGATEDQARSIRALLQAIERFAGVRELIELAHADQAGVVQLLTPPDASEGADSPLAELSTAERMRLVREAVDGNRERVERLEELLQDELRQAEAQAAQMQDPNVPSPGEPSELETLRQKYELAEQLRAQAAAHLDELSDELSRLATGGSGSALLQPARATLSDLEELRRLFFSLVEHLKELLRNQTETHDATATLQFEADADGLDAGLEPTAEQQRAHAEVAALLADAVARQADAAGASSEDAAAEAAERLAEAAGEVQGAAARMEDAGSLLGEAAEEFAVAASPDLEPVLEHQLEAMAHLENAIRLLEPPRQQQQQQQDQQQQQPQPQPQEDEISQRQAQRRLQAIRDREAERQRRRQQPQSSEPVEKDW